MTNDVNVNGMKELNKKLSGIEDNLESIAKSLAKLEKILNRQVPTKQKLVTSWDPINGMDMHLEDEMEEADDEHEMP